LRYFGAVPAKVAMNWKVLHQDAAQVEVDIYGGLKCLRPYLITVVGFIAVAVELVKDSSMRNLYDVLSYKIRNIFPEVPTNLLLFATRHCLVAEISAELGAACGKRLRLA
jgi:hypothetical protein